MKHLIIFFIVLAMYPGSTLAASPDYDACTRQENTLKTRRNDDCSGLSYLFNPSACYAAQKALKSFESGPCRQSTPPAGSSAPAQTPAALSQTPATVVATPSQPLPSLQPAAEPAAATETLQAENARLKSENAKLREELQRFKKGAAP